MFEYGIFSNDSREPHRAGMTLHEAQKWIHDWVHECSGDPSIFSIYRRQIMPWIAFNTARNE